MKKNLLIAAIAITALASCTSNDFVGDTGPQTSSGTVGAIKFSSTTPAITRGTSADAAKINYLFKVFGMKTVGETDQRVFATASSGVTPYDVWFVDNTNNSTTSNSSNWEYVGASGQTYGTTNYTVTLQANQTIKYWDNAATAYYFQAWSDLNDSENKVNISAIDKNRMTIAGTPAKLANLYISDLQTGAPASFASNVVQFTFRKAATKVRLGIYETVPGYQVRNVKFKYTDANSTDQESTSNAILQGKFVGSSSSSATFTVSYDETSKRAVLTPTDNSSNTTFFDFGAFTTGTETCLGEASTSPTWANNNVTDHYISVLPNTTSTNIADMTLKIDYQLYNSASGETINLTNQTAIVPAAYMSWKPNYAYTYLFKITDDKLTPITLDAVVIQDGEGNQETITTVDNPSITTFGVIVNSSDAFKNYVTGNNEYQIPSGGDKLDIYATFMQGTNVLTPQLTSSNKTNYVKVYTVDYKTGATDEEKAEKPITELSVANAIEHTGGVITATEITSSNATTYFATSPAAVETVPGEDGTTKTINAVKLEGAKTAGKYAVEIVTYEEVTGLTVGTSVVTGYYTLAEEVYTKITTENTTAADNTKYYKQVKTYKVIKVVAP